MGFPKVILNGGRYATFMETTKPPHHEQSLQQSLVDNEKLKQDVIRQNYSFRLTDNVGKELVHAAYHLRSPAAWTDYYEGELKRLNPTGENPIPHESTFCHSI